jgi:hypothetical protein
MLVNVFFRASQVKLMTIFAFGLVSMAALFLVAGPAHVATFTVTNTNDDGTGSLRQAIHDANTASGADTIGFDISGSGVHRISVSSELPHITDSVTIDGYTQSDGTPGDSSDDATPNTLSQGNDAVLKIELNGSSAGSASGLRISAGNSTVRGLIINQFTEAAIL